MTCAPLTVTAKHHRAIQRAHDRATHLAGDIRREVEATYGADPDALPVAVRHILDLADDAASYLATALDVLSRETDPELRRKYDPRRSVA